MNAIEIEVAISELAEKPFDSAEFPFEFLQAFGHKETAIKRLRRGTTNKSDLGGVLNNHAANIHIVVCDAGKVPETLDLIKNSEATQKAKTKFALATDGAMLEAEDLLSEDRIACEYKNFPDHFGFFLSLAGISTVKAIEENSFDIRATSKLNRLYVQLLLDNPDWASGEHREDMNHFMARLIFSFFAEDTSIFAGSDLFTGTIEKMSERDASNTHEVISEIFRAMDTKIANRNESAIKRWALDFPYVNGGLFAGSTECPKFSRIARSYLLNVGKLDWTKINPDIFGSMIQAVADDEERGELGMHYTSVPNILKVLNPLFLDDLREALEDAGDNARKLLNLRKRISKIRVFDPACGSGNFLVIAYKELRQIENELNERRGEKGRKTEIPLTNFRGIEIRGFSAEVARLALIIAEYQCDVAYLGQQEALIEFLPLSQENWITCGNALRLDWLSVCPPTGTAVKHVAEDLFEETDERFEIDFANEGGETFICGNPPYKGTKYQSKEEKADLARLFLDCNIKVGNADFVLGWFKKASDFVESAKGTSFAFVSTNSVFEGEQAEIVLWLLNWHKLDIKACHTPFRWANNASHNAGVTCCISVIAPRGFLEARAIFDGSTKRFVKNIGPYLLEMPRIVVTKARQPISQLREMDYGSMSNDSNHFTLQENEYIEARNANPRNREILKTAVGGAEFIRGLTRRCLYIEEDYKLDEEQKARFQKIFDAVSDYRSSSKRAATRKLSGIPHLYAERRYASEMKIFIPQIMSENREYLTVGMLGRSDNVIAPHMQILGEDTLEISILSSKLHLIWIASVCGKLETRYRYSNTLGWNTFPVPKLTEKNEGDLTRCAENILLARESHFPATIADLYDPEKMPENLRQAHEENDETLERIYIGRRFRNDTERLEKLFDMYTKMTNNNAA